jgi:hypothetical protein
MPEVVLRFPEGRYEGEVDGNNIPDGQGSLEFPGNDELERQLYEGGFKAKKADGKGILRWTQGDKYEGDFENGLRHGKGSYLSKVLIHGQRQETLVFLVSVHGLGQSVIQYGGGYHVIPPHYHFALLLFRPGDFPDSGKLFRIPI